MPNNKLTDSEIVKALECCASGEVEECKNCPYVEGYPYCDGPMERDVLDLINRLQAANKRLQSVLLRFLEEMCDWGNKNNIDTTNFSMIPILESEKENLVNQIKAEAYKEFAEKVDKEFSGVGTCNYGWVHHTTRKVLKELVGEDNANKNYQQPT